MMEHRDFVRVCRFNSRCWSDDALFLTLANEREHEVRGIVDIFEDSYPARDRLALRITVKNPETLSSEIEHTFYIPPGDALALGQWLLRRLAQLVPRPPANAKRFYQTPEKAS